MKNKLFFKCKMFFFTFVVITFIVNLLYGQTRDHSAIINKLSNSEPVPSLPK